MLPLTHTHTHTQTYSHHTRTCTLTHTHKSKHILVHDTSRFFTLGLHGGGRKLQQETNGILSFVFLNHRQEYSMRYLIEVKNAPVFLTFNENTCNVMPISYIYSLPFGSLLPTKKCHGCSLPLTKSIPVLGSPYITE